jgi:integral membrane sensor domain MASE1
LKTKWKTLQIGVGAVAANGRPDRPEQVPVLGHDSILRNAYVGAWILGVVLGGLSMFGVIRYPHWVWMAPIACAVLALVANQRIRSATGRAEVLVLGVLTLALLIGAGVLARTAIQVAR